MDDFFVITANIEAYNEHGNLYYILFQLDGTQHSSYIICKDLVTILMYNGQYKQSQWKKFISKNKGTNYDTSKESIYRIKNFLIHNASTKTHFGRIKIKKNSKRAYK